MFLTHFNHVFNIELSDISSDATINVGNAVLKGFSANSESVGSQSVIGSRILCPGTNLQLNIVFDPDLKDQPQLQL